MYLTERLAHFSLFVSVDELTKCFQASESSPDLSSYDRCSSSLNFQVICNKDFIEKAIVKHKIWKYHYIPVLLNRQAENYSFYLLIEELERNLIKTCGGFTVIELGQKQHYCW